MGYFETATQAARVHAGGHASRVGDWADYTRRLIRRKVIVHRKHFGPTARGGHRWIMAEPEDWFALRQKDGEVEMGPAETLTEIKEALGVLGDGKSRRGLRKFMDGLYITWTKPRPDTRYSCNGDSENCRIIGQAGRLAANGFNPKMEHEV